MGLMSGSGARSGFLIVVAYDGDKEADGNSVSGQEDRSAPFFDFGHDLEEIPTQMLDANCQVLRHYAFHV